MKSKGLLLFFTFLFILCGHAYAEKEVKYNRDKAVAYALLYSPTKNYNHKEYKCWNADLAECVKDNPGLTGHVDCANFASQSLIDGGIDFNDIKESVLIGKNENSWRRGHIAVSKLLPGLTTSFCFDVITDPSKAKKGDILSFKNMSHVAVYAGDNTYHAHTTDRTSQKLIWSSIAEIYHFKDDNKCQKCVRESEGYYFDVAMLKNKCDQCSTCDAITSECASNCGTNGTGRCASTKKCVKLGEQNICMDFGPGGDCPDDTFTVGTSTPSSHEAVYPSSYASVGILNNGYSYDVLKVLSTFGRDARFVELNSFDPSIATEMPLLIIPSAGLMGISNSEFFKLSLNEYLKKGGTVFVLAQQYGYDFAAIPGGLSAYGWQEDQSCQANSSYIATWHQILSGQTRSTPNLNVDGYFTSYPENATVLLKRTVNGQPALITYPYENGRVIATTAFTDYAYTSNQASTEEMSLLRDIVSWAVKPVDLPEITPGQAISLDLNVKNYDSNTTATAAVITVYDPDGNSEKLKTKAPVNVLPGQSIKVPLTYSSNSTDPKGIYRVKYELLAEGYQQLTSEEDPEGVDFWTEYLLQPSIEESSGRFAASNPSTYDYSYLNLLFGITSPSENVYKGENVTYTVNIWNNYDVDKHLRLYTDWSHRIASFLDEIVVPAGSSVSKAYQIALPENLSGNHRLWVHFFGEGESQNAVKTARNGDAINNEIWPYVGAFGKGFNISSPSIDVVVNPDKPAYLKSESVNIAVELKNKQQTAFIARQNVKISDPLNKLVFSQSFDSSLTAVGTALQNLNFAFPAPSVYGYYTISIESVDSSGKKIGGAYSSFELPKPMLSIIPVLPQQALGLDNDLSFGLTNTGKVAIPSAYFSASLIDPAGNSIWNSGNLSMSLLSGEQKAFDFPLTFSSLQFGDYKLVYSAVIDDTTISGEKIIPNTIAAQISFNKPSYRMRDTTVITVDLTNTGLFNLENMDLMISVPGAAFTETKAISIAPGVTYKTQSQFAIPVTIIPGQHTVEVRSALPGGGTFAADSKLTVPESKLNVGYSGPVDLNPGSIISLSLDNTGGVDTGYVSEKLVLIDNKGKEIYQGSSTGTILAGEGKFLASIKVPSQAAAGSLTLYAGVNDSKTGVISTLHRQLNIKGVQATISSKTSKDVYLSTESVSPVTTLSNGPVAISGGALDITVATYGDASINVGSFKHLMPKYGWKPLYAPDAMAIGPDGSIYVIEEIHWSRVKKFDSNGNFITQWGTYGSGDGQFWYPQAIAVGPDGSVYVADTSNNRIQKFDSNGNFLTKWGSKGNGDGQFIDANAIAVAPDGSVYVSDGNGTSARMQRFDSNGNFIGNFLTHDSSGGKFNGTLGLAVGTDGYIYITSTWSSKIYKYDNAGNLIKEWGGPTYYNTNYSNDIDGFFDYPTGISIGPDGAVYVADTGRYRNRVQKFDSNGNFIAKWSIQKWSYTNMTIVGRIAVGPNGTVYVTNGINKIQRFSNIGAVLEIWPASRFVAQDGAVDSSGIVYTVNNGGYIGRFDRNGDVVNQGSYNWKLINGASLSGIATAPDDSIYVVDSSMEQIYKFASNGAQIKVWGGYCKVTANDECNGKFYNPERIAVGPDGSVYVTESGNHRVQKFDGNGTFITKWGNYGFGDGQFDWPVGIAVNASGEVLVVDMGNNRIQKFKDYGGFISKLGSEPACVTDTDYDGINEQACDGLFNYPYGITVGPDGTLFVIDTWNNRIQLFDSNWNFLGKSGSLGHENGQFFLPLGAALDPKGYLYVLDTSNHRVQKAFVSFANANGPTVLFKDTVPVNQTAGTSQNYSTSIGVLNARGKVYLEADLLNNIGQVIATSEYPFYITEGSVVLLYSTDKKIYRPGEMVTVTGEVKNLSAVSLDNAILELTTGSNLVLNQAITVVATGSHPFTATLVADAEGLISLVGEVKHGASTLSRVKDQFEVASPKISAVLTAPDVVGRDPFDVNLEIKNDGRIDVNLFITASGGELADQRQISIPSGQSQLLQYKQQIASPAQYSISLSGDIVQTLEKAVVYGEAVQIELGNAPVYKEGSVSIPVKLTNSGQIDERINVTYRLSGSAGVVKQETRTYYIPKDGNLTDNLNYSLLKGEYVLSAESSAPVAQVSVPCIVSKENDISIGVSLGSQLTGLLPVSIDISNNGWNDIAGSIAVHVLDKDGIIRWRGEISLPLSALNSYNELLNVDQSSLAPGSYELKTYVYDASGQELASKSSAFLIEGAVFELTQVPLYPVLTAGQEGSLVFGIKNTGNHDGELKFTVKSLDMLESTVTEWLAPGEEKTFTFNLIVPDDFEEKDYFADYAIEGGESGQVKYRVAGINIAVNAILDKSSYNVGDAAQLSLVVSNKGGSDGQNFFARINYAGFEDKKSFTLSGSNTLAFSIPLNKITGEKLFYGIYHEDGRSIHLNSIYVYKNSGVLDIITDKQVYNPEERVSMTISGGNGTLTLEAPGNYKETISLTGSDSKSFNLPVQMTAGTYYIKYTLTDSSGNITSGNHPFDVAGIQVKIKEALLDKAKYAATDSMKLKLTVESNRNMPATLKAWIVTPEGDYKAAGNQSISLSSMENALVTQSVTLSTTASGIHRVVYGIYSGGMLLSSGSEAFDVGDAVLLDLSTDNSSYPEGNETINLIADLYGTVPGTIEYFVDDVSLEKQSVDLNGFVKINKPITSITPGLHAIKAVLTSGGLISKKEVSIDYGTNLPDLVVSIAYSQEISIDNKMKVTITVTNQGKKDSTATNVPLYDKSSQMPPPPPGGRSLPPSSGGTGTLLQNFTVNNLAPGESASFVYLLDVTGKAGSRTLEASVDPENAVYEYNENNNSGLLELTIPQLALYMALESDTFYAGDSVTISTKVTNLSQTQIGDIRSPLILLTEVKDQNGSVVFNKMDNILPISGGSQVPLVVIWNVSTGAEEGIYAINQTLTYDRNTYAASKSVQIKAGKDFTLESDITGMKVESGGKADYNIIVGAVKGFAEPVTLTVTGYPLGATVYFTNNTVTPTSSTVLKVATSPGVAAGTYTLVVTASGGGKTHSMELRLDVSDFEMTIVPLSHDIQELGSAEYPIDLSPLNEFESPIHLVISGLPKGVKASFDNNDMALPSQVKLKLITSKWARPGNYEFKVTASGMTAYHEKTLTLVINPNLSIAPGLVTASGPGPQNKADIKFFTSGGLQTGSWRAFDSEYGANIASGDIDGDGFDEIVVGTGPDTNGRAMLQVFERNGSPLSGAQVVPFNMNYGVTIAVGDIDGDWIEEIVVGTGPDPKGEPRVKVYKYDGLKLYDTGIDLYPYKNEGYKYGVNVSLADTDGDGLPEILTAPGPDTTAAAIVKAFKVNYGNNPGNWTVTGQVLDFKVDFNNKEGYGANIASGDLDGDGLAEIIVASGPNSTNDAMVIKVYRADGTMKGESFNAYAGYKYGAYIACGDLDLDGKDEIITGAGPDPKNKSLVRIFRGDGAFLGEFLAYPSSIKYGVKATVGRIGIQ